MRPGASFEPRAPSRRFLATLVVLALATRLAWVLWIHPPWAYVFSDMAGYLHRAQQLVTEGFVFGDRTLAWQVYGTHTLLAIPLAIFGAKNLVSAAVLQALFGAATVPLTYLLALRTVPRRPIPEIAGVAVLAWYPNLSHTGYFLSEPAFACLQLASTLGLVRLSQTGKGAVWTGLAAAATFVVRPQSALFFTGALVVYLVAHRSMPRARPRHVTVVAGFLAAALAVSVVRFYLHTGRFDGIAENANMNLTAGRCHNIVTQAFASEQALARSDARRSTRDGRRVSLPGFRALARVFPDDHPLGLRPALGGETIKFVGYIGDGTIHRRIRQRCYERTGLVGQLRYSLTNVMLLWFVSPPWPEVERGRERFYPPARAFVHLYQALVLLPSLVGLVLALARTRRNPFLALVALQPLTSITTAAIFFGSVRLRAPYDPYAILLALWVYRGLARRLGPRVRRAGARTAALGLAATTVLAPIRARAAAPPATGASVQAPAPGRPAGATFVATVRGVDLYALPAPEAHTAAFLAETTVRAPLAKVAALLWDGDHHAAWFHQAKHTRTLRKRAGGFDVYYHLGSPPPVADRDVVLRVRVQHFDGGCRFAFSTYDDPAVPSVPDRVRMPRLDGAFELVRAGPRATRVRLWVVADPGGRLPAFMVRRGVREIPLRTLANLAQRVR